MHKIIPLLAASILSSVSVNPSSRAGIVIPGRSSKFNFSKDFSGGGGVSFGFSGLNSISFSQTPRSSSSLEEPSSSSSSSSKSSSSSSSSKSQSSSSSSIYSSSSSSKSSSSYTPDPDGDYFSCPRYGPFILNNVPTTTVSFTYELNSISSQTILERVRLFRSGSLVSGNTSGSFSYTKGTRRTTSFTIPIRDYWTTNGLEIRFEILNSSYSILKAYIAPFYPPTNGQVSASTLKSNLYTSKSIGFYGDGVEMKELREIFDFRTIGDYIDNDYYYRLDIARNYFLYPNDFVLSYKNNAKLRFNDSENIFPYYTHQSNGDIEIPLYLYANGDRICFGFNKTFYVNKRTLQISDTYQSGWITTPSFYLPVNGRKAFNGKMIYFELNELGFDKISTVIPLRYELDRTMVGVCSDGEYCVVGGDS